MVTDVSFPAGLSHHPGIEGDVRFGLSRAKSLPTSQHYETRIPFQPRYGGCLLKNGGRERRRNRFPSPLEHRKCSDISQGMLPGGRSHHGLYPPGSIQNPLKNVFTTLLCLKIPSYLVILPAVVLETLVCIYAVVGFLLVAFTHTDPYSSCTIVNPVAKKIRELGCLDLVTVPTPLLGMNVTSTRTRVTFVTIPICPSSCPAVPFTIRQVCPIWGCTLPRACVRVSLHKILRH